MSLPHEIAGIFTERFPRYLFELPTWDEVPTSGQADQTWLNGLSLQHTEILYLYGINDTAALLLKSWLQEDQKRRLIFLEPEAGKIVHFLKKPFAAALLEIEQIAIFHLPTGLQKSSLLQELAETYPFRGIAIAQSPGVLDRQRFARVKMQLLRKTALTHALYVDRLYSHLPLANLLKNLRHLPSAFYVNRMKNAFRNVPAVICGAGPSLQASFEKLSTMENQALIFAGGSAISALSAQGIAPHFAVAIDPNRDEFQRLKNNFSFEVPFLFSSRLFPDCLAACNGPLGYLRSGMSGLVELWFEEELGLTDPILGEKLPPESLSVTTLCAALAHHFGCNPILFDGLDLAYTQNQRYVEGVMARETENKENLQPVDLPVLKKDRHGKAVVSAVRWVMESNALSLFAKQSKDCRWINCTQDGIGLKGVEALPLSEAAKLFSSQRDIRSMVHHACLHSPMPEETALILARGIEKLRKSLETVIKHLEIIIENQNRGRVALAELEIKEELAFDILFFDIEKTLQTAFSLSASYTQEKSLAFWKAFHELALNCLNAF